jgi:hypothetical protein
MGSRGCLATAHTSSHVHTHETNVWYIGHLLAFVMRGAGKTKPRLGPPGGVSSRQINPCGTLLEPSGSHSIGVVSAHLVPRCGH